nr:porin family protein [Acidobacteriota bacterium]
MQTRRVDRIRRALSVTAIFSIVMMIPAAALAQSEFPDPRTEIFVGYSYYNPGDDSLLFPHLAADKGFNAAVTWNFNRYVGFTFDTSGHYGDNINVGNFGFGPTVKYPLDRATPFAHALFGFQKASPLGFQETAFLTMIGGGLDLRLTRLFSWRLFQADWVRSNHSFLLGSQDDFNGARLSTGIVFNLGSLTPSIPPSATCSASPTEVVAGESVTVTATPSNFNPKHELDYAWT